MTELTPELLKGRYAESFLEIVQFISQGVERMGLDQFICSAGGFANDLWQGVFMGRWSTNEVYLRTKPGEARQAMEMVANPSPELFAAMEAVGKCVGVPEIEARALPLLGTRYGRGKRAEETTATAEPEPLS